MGFLMFNLNQIIPDEKKATTHISTPPPSVYEEAAQREPGSEDAALDRVRLDEKNLKETLKMSPEELEGLTRAMQTIIDNSNEAMTQ
jgi:hypothetical protein